MWGCDHAVLMENLQVYYLCAVHGLPYVAVVGACIPQRE